jgi:OOP family OmpA-OmpF porin
MDLDFRFSPFEILTGSGTLIVCLFFICVFSEVATIEEEIGTSVTVAVNSDELYWSSVEADGQAVVLTGAAPDVPARDAALRRAESIWGVSNVNNSIKVIGADGMCQQELNDYAAKERIRFKSGKAEVVDSSFNTISMLAMIIRACDAPIEIAGHTDSAGDSEINLRLSQRRADRVAKYLVNHGVPAEQVRAVGYGESQPVSGNDTTEGRKMNRRIEFRVLGGTA